MQNVFRLPVQSQQDMGHPSTEEDAIAVAKEFARRVATSRSSGEAQALPYRELEWIAQAGLLGVSVPAEFGGPDLANASLATIIAIAAEANPLIGESLTSHFSVLEGLRAAASPAQQKFFFAGALAGEQFCHVSLSQPSNNNDRAMSPPQAQLSISRSGCSLSGTVRTLLPLFADWIAVTAVDAKGQGRMALIHRDTEEITFKDMSIDAEHAGRNASLIAFDDVHIAADSILAVPAEEQRPSTPTILGLLLDSAIDLGIARAMLRDLADKQRDEWADLALSDPLKDDRLDILNALGCLAAGIEGVAAMVERTGLHLDIAQIDASAESERQAWLSAVSANILSSGVLREAVTTIFDLHGPRFLSTLAYGRFADRHASYRDRMAHRYSLGRHIVAASTDDNSIARY